jgi:vacuolar-type H+-ATPase subunit F/Vma7
MPVNTRTEDRLAHALRDRDCARDLIDNLNTVLLVSITGITAGTVAAGKTVVVDDNKDVTGFRNVGLTGTQTFSGATGANIVAVPDNLADALSFKEGSTAYITIVTTNSSEAVQIKKSLVVTSGTIDCSSGATDIKIPDNNATALRIREATNDYFIFVSTDSAEKIRTLKQLSLESDFQQQFSAASVDGAIIQKSGVVYITKAGVAVLTIGNPTATTDDGKILTIIATTANAHTLDNSAGAGFNGGGAGADVGTFGGAKGDNIVLTAYQGVWYIVGLRNVTLA